jgi:MYXO-CTERM domain-containing protein
MSRAFAVLYAVSFPSLALAGVSPNANGPYTVDAEGSVAMSSSGSTTSACVGTTSYAWDFDGDGDTDSTSSNPTYTATGIDGPQTFTTKLTMSNTICTTSPSSASDTATTTVNNVNPTISATSGSTSTVEGTTQTYDVTYGDVESADTHSFTWDWNDGSTSTTKGASHAWADEGTYAVEIEVADDDGGTVTKSFSVVVTNVSPTLSSTTWSSAANEGATLTFEAMATDPGTADTLTYTWTFGDGTTAKGTSVTHAYADQGSFGVTITVDDGDGGSDSDSGTIKISNVAPEASGATGPASGLEGETLSWTAAFTDGGSGDSHEVTWDFGDGTTATGASASHAYADEGTYSASYEVCDDDGACDTFDWTVTVANATPVIDEIAGPTTGLEGDDLAFDCVASDAGTADVLSYAWDFDDGATDTAMSVSHAWDDDGAYVIACTVTDDDGASESLTLDVVLENADPVVVGTPDATVEEGQPYSFDPDMDDPGVADSHTWSLVGPSGMTIDASTQEIAWTPGWEDEGTHTVRLTVDDDDGGRGTLEWTIEVTMVDADGDRMSDLWEADHGLNPADASDAATDPDGDARANLDEFVNGWDPNAYDGPSTPVAVSPVDGSEIATEPLSLVVTNATSPVGDELVYHFEIYEDASMTTLLTAGYDVAEGEAETTWQIDTALTENTWYFWWSAAEDTWTTGAWSTASSFFFNTTNDAPGAPTVTSPLPGSTTTDTTPALVVQEAVDPDEDALIYSFRLYDSGGAELAAYDDILGDGLQASWTPDDALADDTEFCWEAWATDPDGLVGPSTGVNCFVIDSNNLAPSEPAILEPGDGAIVTSLTPEIRVEDGVDPEGRNVWHRFELDSSPTFASADLQVAEIDEDDGTTSWTSDELAEDTTYHLRVLATDGAANSNWTTITFTVDTANEPPSVPALHNPADGASWAGDALEIVNATDPEGEALTYDFSVLDAQGAEADGATDVAEDASGYTAWTPGELAPGSYTWTARAVDASGGVSDWADPRSFEVMGEEDTDRPGPDDSGDDTQDDKGGCGCASGASPSGVGLLAFAAVLLGLRRRR